MRIFLGLSAVSLVAAGCLLVNPLDKLEGSPLEEQAGAGGSGGTGTGSGGTADDAGGTNGNPTDADAQAGPPVPVLFRDRKNGGIPRGIALSDKGVYWAEVSPLGILYAPKDATDAAPAVVHVDTNTDLLNDVFDVAVDGSSLYWTEYTQDVVHRKPLAGGNMDTAYFNGAVHAAYLTLTGAAHVFLTDYNTTISAIVEGPPSLSVANNQRPPAAGIAFCGGSVFWAWGQPSVIAWKDPNSTLPADYYTLTSEADGGTDSGSITGLACDNANFYWIQDNRSIRCVDRVQRAPEELLYIADKPFAEGTNVGDIAVDDAWIYFTKPLERAIYKLAKPLPRDR
jgi:hypothetical protein